MKELNSHAQQIAKLLQKNHPHPKTELVYENPYQLAIAVMLSAQTTDKKVNQITPNLFKRFPDWVSLSQGQLSEVENLIYGVNFHKGKAQRLIEAGKVVTSEFGGELPKSMSDLMKIPGIARKSANVIMQVLWDITEGIVVDTHVTRVSYRLGLTINTDPKKIEQDLMKIVPKKFWRNLSGSMVLHGRYVCIARKPLCSNCFMNHICPKKGI